MSRSTLGRTISTRRPRPTSTFPSLPPAKRPNGLSRWSTPLRRLPQSAAASFKEHANEPPATSPLHQRDRRAESASCRRRMERRDPARVALAYTPDSRWRNRSEFIQGRDAIEAFFTRKWNRELDYRLIKEVWTYSENRSPCASPMNGMTTAETGSAAMATRNGNSMNTA